MTTLAISARATTVDCEWLGERKRRRTACVRNSLIHCSEEAVKNIPEMISGDWHPTPDPTGRQVQFADFSGTFMEGTVVGVEYQEDREPTLYIEVADRDGSRREYGVNAKSIVWLDVDRPAWTESEHPLGRWVVYHDGEGLERFGVVVAVSSCHSNDAVLDVMPLRGPGALRTFEVPWRKAKWLPQ